MIRRKENKPERRRRLPRILRWPLRIVSTALILALTLAFLPHLTRWAARIWPDPARTTRVSEILKHELRESAKLELVTVDDQGVLTASVQAALIGEVQRVTIEYDYHASIGIDLNQTEVVCGDGVLTLLLPPMEIISDSLTPTKVDRQDFWYPLTEKRRSKLLSEEREARAKAALTDAEGDEALKSGALQSLERMVNSWLGADTWLTTVEIRFREESTEEPGGETEAP